MRSRLRPEASRRLPAILARLSLNCGKIQETNEMCQSTVYTVDQGQEECILEDVAWVGIEGNQVTLRTLFREPVCLSARIKEIDLMKHRIILEGCESG